MRAAAPRLMATGANFALGWLALYPIMMNILFLGRVSYPDNLHGRMPQIEVAFTRPLLLAPAGAATNYGASRNAR
jgi:hypothetical protein